MADDLRPQLYVCTTCRRAGTPKPVPVPAPGQLLYDAVARQLLDVGPEVPVRAVPMVCFGNCEQGCSAGLASPGKWTYLMGKLGPEHAADLIAWAAAYARSPNGTVLRSGRPQSLRDTIVARFPGGDLAAASPQLAE